MRGNHHKLGVAVITCLLHVSDVIQPDEFANNHGYVSFAMSGRQVVCTCCPLKTIIEGSLRPAADKAAMTVVFSRTAPGFTYIANKKVLSKHQNFKSNRHEALYIDCRLLVRDKYKMYTASAS